MTIFRNNVQLGRLIRMSSFDYVSNHFREIFGHSEAILKLAQRPNVGGWLRSDVDREKIYEYGKRRLEHLRNLGLIQSPRQIPHD